MTEEKKISRRDYGRVVVGTVGGLAVGAAAGYLLKPVPSEIEKTTTQTVERTVTRTVTSTPAPTTPTVGGKLSIIMEKGWYPEEDLAKQWLVNQFSAETGIAVELNLFAEEDAHKRVVAGCQAGNPPDLGFTRMWDWTGQELAWQGWLEDVSDVVDEVKARGDIFDWSFRAAHLYNNVVGERAYYFVPFAIDSVHFSYWRTFLDEAGMASRPEDIPVKFDEFFDFWKEAQDKLKTKITPYPNGIGFPSLGGIGVNPGDGWAQIAHLMAWHGWKPIAADGSFAIDTPSNIAAFEKTVQLITDLYDEGYTPVGMTEWASPDNNTAFHSKGVITVMNASMSIPLARWSADPDDYFDRTASLREMPLTPGGEPSVNLWHTFGWHMFKDAKNKAAARQFVKWFIEPENLNTYMVSAGGRMFPASQAVIEEEPFWKEGKTDTGRIDPHLPGVYNRLKKGPNEPFWHQMVGHPGFKIIDCYPLAACHRTIVDRWSASDAVAEANDKWNKAVAEYTQQMK